MSATPSPGPRGLLLASASPARRELLTSWGYTFTWIDAGAPEVTDGVPGQVALRNAHAKARAADAAGAVVLAADTVIALDGEILGKPDGRETARAWIRRMAGRSHEVWTGVVVRVREGDRALEGIAGARVRFRCLQEPEIESYLATGEWQGRAGGYGIQGAGAGLVERLAGEVEVVVGLPRLLTQALLAEAGVRP